MSIVIIGDLFTFPDGNAATNRVYSYSKGFVALGVSTHIICFYDEELIPGNGVIHGIYYYHPGKLISYSENYFLRKFRRLMKYWETISRVRKIHHEDSILVIHCYTNSVVLMLFSWLLSVIVGTKLTLERSEHPLKDYKTNWSNKLKGKWRLLVEKTLFDGIICISGYLVNFYHELGIAKDKLFIVPSIVDTSRFEINIPAPLPVKYLLYCGSLTILKDGVDILIKSFQAVAPEHPDLYLTLIGKGDTLQEEELIRNQVAKSEFKDRIILLGQLPRDLVPAYMIHAHALMLSRPKSMIADAGFPTKLTEYLATSKPVVVTSVGDLTQYLADGENAFVAIPNSIEAFADKIRIMLNDYNHSLEIAVKGKMLTETVFNSDIQAKRMLEFFGQLSKLTSE